MKNFFIIVSVFLSMQVSGQHPNILIGNVNDPNEPSIMINPKNPDQMVAGANIAKVFLSDDGGSTWSESQLSSEYGVWGDPCILADTSGAFYFLHLSNPDQGNWIDRIVCQKMTGFSGTWDNGSFMGLDGTKAQDKEWGVVNPTNNHIYVCWTQFDQYGSTHAQDSSIIRFSKSTDGGQSWSTPVRINKTAGDCVDEDNTVEGAVPCVGPQGQIYVSWAGPLGLVFNRSLDEGNNWLPQEIPVSDMPGGWDFGVPGIYRCNGMPVTCCDLSSGTYQGNIYVNWSDQRNGPLDTDVWLSKSTDGGNTWCPPKRVNNDPPGKQNFFTWMTVDQTTGYLYFIFYDRRNYNNDQTDVFLAISKDGGDSFVNYKISESPFLPSANIFFGDYTNISVVNGTIRPIWTRLHQGTLSLYTALVNPDIVGIEDKDMLAPEVDEVFPNPFNECTFFSYKVRRPCHITLKLIDNLGREVSVLTENTYKPAGKYIVRLNADDYHLTPGVYYFSLSSDSNVVKHQVLLVK